MNDSSSSTTQSTGVASGDMTLTEHLGELRLRLFKIALALTVGGVIGFVLFDDILGVLLRPYCQVDSAFRSAGSDVECQLLALNPLDPFTVRIKTSLVFGAFVGGPVIFFQLWQFIAPGLTSKEKRYSLPFVVLSQVMFACGISFAYFIIPQGLQILLDMGGPQIVSALSASEYLSFILTTAVAFGLVFETPLVLVFLALLGIVSAAGLRKFRAYAVVLNVIVAAIVTPTTDAVTLFFMAGPMLLFYEIAIVAAALIERGRRRRKARA